MLIMNVDEITLRICVISLGIIECKRYTPNKIQTQ